MKFTFLGTGTSQGIPVIGCNCPVCVSANPHNKRLRTAGMVSSGTTNIVIDVGPDFRQQMLQNNVHKIDAIILTHEHNDHIIGLDDVRPYNFLFGKNIPVYASIRVIQELYRRFSYIFEKNPYPGSPRLELFPISKDCPFVIGDLSIIPVEVMHGAIPIFGYRIGALSYLTDVKTIASDQQTKVIGTEVLVLNALRQKEHHSHLNLSQALALINEINPKQAYLTHISHRMGLPEDIEPFLPSNVAFAYDGLEVELIQ